jgi:hypothetical protein
MASLVKVNDSMQQGYEYLLSEKPGCNFDPQFAPELTPAEMLSLGVFGGVYLRDCTAEFPGQWFAKAKLARESRDPELNYFRVDASLPLSEWVRKGWIYPDDPRGWFQWYCRSEKIVSLAIATVAENSGRPCCTGPTIPVLFRLPA